MMYKARHQLMESLNENGLYTAKCYNEMLDGTPLARIVVPKGKHHHVSEEVKSPQLPFLPSPHNDDDDDDDDDDSFTSSGSTDESGFVASNNNNNAAAAAANPHPSPFLQGRVPYTENYNDDIDSTEYPDNGVVKRETLEPDEGSRIPRELVSKPMQEPEGMKASRVMSVYASSSSGTTSQFAAGLDEPEGVKASKVMSVKASGASQFPASKYPAVSNQFNEPEGKKEGVKASKMGSVKASSGASKFPAVSNEPEGKKEGMKASKMVSVKASEDVSRNGSEKRSRNNKDPPSAHYITSGKSIAADENYERTGDGNPPSRKSFSDDKTEISVEKNPSWESDDVTDRAVHRYVGDGINQIIVDDDEDSFTHGKVSSTTVVSIEDRKRESGNEEADEFAKGFWSDDEEVPPKLPYAPLVPNAQSENGSTNDDADTRSKGSNSAGDVEKIGNEDQDYLNISNDGELLVIKGSPKPGHTSPQPEPFDSYFDVHKAHYKEMKSKLDEHSHLVVYVKTWMETVSMRVQGRYIRYGKHRNGLNHYTSKVNSLRHEQEKLKEKNKTMKPKQIDKLERNKAKLMEASETHDETGESLLMLMEEVTLRSWRDAFPLLKKSIMFECDFATITHLHMAKLSKSLELLDTIADKESIATNGRLEKIRSKDPENIYTGSRFRVSARGE